MDLQENQLSVLTYNCCLHIFPDANYDKFCSLQVLHEALVKETSKEL